MKVAKALRDVYDACYSDYELLLNEVEQFLKPKVEVKSWFYYHRLKGLESFVLKVESGRVPDPRRMEDFFACTIVVPTAAQIEHATELVLSNYDLRYRRPKSDSFTYKASSSFAFDDLRLYVSRRTPSSGRRPDLSGLVFEIQVKTTLQHAWGIATHGLIYKSNSVNWSLERIAYQVKAMLEHAEVAISEATLLATAIGVAKEDRKTSTTSTLIDKLRNTWSEERLPGDIRRLAEVVNELFVAADIGIECFEEVIAAEKGRIGQLPLDLSPYSFTVQALANFNKFEFERKFKRRSVRTSILVHRDMDIPEWMKDKHDRIIHA